MGPIRPAAFDLLDRTFRSKPLVFVTFAWMVGTGLADHWALMPAIAGVIGLALGIAALILRQRWLSLALLLLGVAVLGLAATRVALIPPRGDISEWSERQVGIDAVVTTEPVARCDRWRCTVDCLAVIQSGWRHPAHGRLYVTTAQDLSRLEPGDRVMVYGVPERPSPARNPGGFSLECWLAQRGAFATLVAMPGELVQARANLWDWRRCAALLRHRIVAANRRVMGDPAAAVLVNSLLFGDQDPDNEQLWSTERESFSRTGLYHVLVVDGAKVGLLFALPFAWRHWALRPQREARRRRWRLVRAAGGFSYRQSLILGLILLAFYVPLVGLQPTIGRATLIAVVFSLARCLDRETDPENTLAAAALILLAANPLALYDLSFQFSFAGVWGMIRGTAPLKRALSLCVPSFAGGMSNPELSPAIALQRLLGSILTATAFLLAAQFATAPLQAYYFQTVALIGPLANPPAVILSTVLIPVGFVSSLLAAFLTCLPGARALAQWISWPAEQLARLMNAMVAAFARPTWGTVSVLPPSWPEIALYSILLLAATTPLVRRRRFASPALLALAITALAISVLRPAPAVSVPTLTFIDVGQGDGCLIRLPGGANLLVDGGGSPRAPCARRDCSDAPVGHLADSIRRDCLDVGRDTLASFLRYERVRRIDLMILTHPHDDHLWGLDALLDPRQGFDIRAVLDVGPRFRGRAYTEWFELLRRRRLIPIAARRGMELTVGPARLVVLHPTDAFLQHVPYDSSNSHIVNDNSIVLRIDLPGTRVLLTGDAEAEAEASMGDQDVQADVLKVGHHGSAYSTSDAWLDRVHPRIAVISCGRHNAFGHPSPYTVARLLRHHVQVYRTDQDGAVMLQFGPAGWTATTMIQPVTTRE